MARMCDSRKEAWWRHHLGQWQSSGDSIRVFCARVGVSEQNFYRWRRVLEERGVWRQAGQAKRPLFVPVEVEEEGGSQSNSIEVVLSGGQRVGVRPGFDPATLARVVAVLEGR